MLRKNKSYIIDDYFLFEPLLCLIKNLQTGESAVLSQSSSDCLTLLLSQPNAIVPRRDLMAYGWECYNLSVTDNNLNQNIAAIRKKFKEIGLAKVIIKTVPRKGLSISSDISVSNISEKNHEESNVGDINKVEFLPDSESGCIEEPSINTITPSVSFYKQKNIYTTIICIVIFISIIILLSYFKFHKKSGATVNPCYYSSYRLLKKENKHIIFGNDEVTPDDILYALNFSKSQYIDSRYTFIYITSYKFIPRKTILYCNRAFDNSKNRDCISQYIFKN